MSQPTLSYGRYDRRRVYKRALLIALPVVIGGILAVCWFLPWQERMTEWRRVQRMMTFSYPTGTVVYQENPPQPLRDLFAANERAMKGQNYERDYGEAYRKFVAAVPSGWHPPNGSFPPPLLEWGFVGPSAVPFLHQRAAASGTPRIVVVTVIPSIVESNGAMGATLDAMVFAAPTSASAPFLSGISVASDSVRFPIGTLRIFAGQADPSDASHFQIPYQLDGQDGMIDGWLMRGDKVRFTVRSGPATTK